MFNGASARWRSMQLLKMVHVENMPKVLSLSPPSTPNTPEGPRSVTVALHSTDSQPGATHQQGQTNQLPVTAASATSTCIP